LWSPVTITGANAGGAAFGHRGPDLLARRVDLPGQAEQAHPPGECAEAGRRIERIVVDRGEGQHAPRPQRHRLGRGARRLAARRIVTCTQLQHRLGRALDVDVARRVGQAVARGHQLGFGIEGQLGLARRLPVQGVDLDAGLARQHQQRAFGRVTEHRPGAAFILRGQ